MAIYASSHNRGTERVDVATLGAVSAPLAAHGQVVVARARRPGPVQAQPIAVQSSTSVPSGQRT